MKLEKAVFFNGYHPAVDDCLIQDLLAIGMKIYMPSDTFGQIWFFAPNDRHKQRYPEIEIINKTQFLSLPPMYLLSPCRQTVESYQNLWRERREVDALVYLNAQTPELGAWEKNYQFVLAQDLNYYREVDATVKMLYLARPEVPQLQKDYGASFEGKEISMFCNNLRSAAYHAEVLEDLRVFRESYPQTKFFGFSGEHGNLSRQDAQTQMSRNFLTLSFKSHETWGNAVLESMLLGTPCIFLRKFNRSIFREYLINEDTAIIGDTVNEVTQRIEKLNRNNYEIMGMEAREIAKLLTSDGPRREHLDWFFSKIQSA